LIARFVSCRSTASSRTASDNLLRQHIKRTLRENQPVELTQANRAHEHGAFSQIVARGDKKSSFGNRAAPVTGPPHALQSNRNRARGTYVAH
jgi:hypothetical protein